MQLLKQLGKNRSFSIIEIIIALAFSSVLITTFIALSAWGLNNAKDNEVEDIASQSLMELNDLLRSPQDVNVANAYDEGYLPTPEGVQIRSYYSINPNNKSSINWVSTAIGNIFVLEDNFNLEYCKTSEGSVSQVVYLDRNGTASTQNIICVLALITKVTADPLDNRYYYKVKVVAEKSGSKFYEETIDGMRVGKITGMSGGGSGM